VLVTRFELFLRSHGIAPSALSKKTVQSRQHVLRLRLGESLAPRRCILTIAAACEALTGEPVAPATLFESADVLLAGRGRRLSDTHAMDLTFLEKAINGREIGRTIRLSGIATETAAAYLLRAGRQRACAQPAEATAIFGAAIAMTRSLEAAPRELVAALYAEGLRARAGTLRQLGNIDEALEDLGIAAGSFAEARYCDGEAADVDSIRAGALFALGRSDEAIVAAQDARGHFLAAGDRRGAAHAELGEACMRFDHGDSDGARKIFHRLRETFWKLRDADTLTRVWLNLALCEIRRGDRASARHWLHRAGAAARSRGDGAQLLRTRWIVAKYAARFRGLTLGAAALRCAERAFTDLGKTHDAASAVLFDLRSAVRASRGGLDL